MLNKNNFLTNKRVVNKILEIALLYKGETTIQQRKELLNILKEERFASDKVDSVTIYISSMRYNGHYRDGFSISLTEYFKSNWSSRRHSFTMSKDFIDRWLEQ